MDIGTRWELFVDDFLMAEMRGVRLDLKRPERREVAFVADAAWEDDVAFPLSVFEDRDTVRMYYRAAILDRATENEQVTALAESTDGGRSFCRPDLGLVEFQGSRHNNILHIGGAPHVPPAFKDTKPDCEPGERYKGFGAKWRQLYALCSADGLRWRVMEPAPLEIEGTFDTVNTAFWDPAAGCYRSFTRSFMEIPPDGDAPEPQPTSVRIIQSSTSPDFVHWSAPAPHQYRDCEERTQLYTNATLPCPCAEHIYLSFPNRFVEHRVTNPEHPYPGVNDALFMVSRDCVRWTRYLEAWVRPGLDPMNWSDRNNYPIWGIVRSSPAEWSMYISEHYRQADAPTQMRRLSIRPHGFVSARADWAGGEFATKPVILAGRQLRLNFCTSAAGSVRVEIQGEGGKRIPGFGLADMQPLFGDELDRVVSWRGGGDLAALIGRPVRFRFALKDADVFAMRMSS
jgi:hypothetical protein